MAKHHLTTEMLLKHAETQARPSRGASQHGLFTGLYYTCWQYNVMITEFKWKVH